MPQIGQRNEIPEFSESHDIAIVFIALVDDRNSLSDWAIAPHTARYHQISVRVGSRVDVKG
jgi:hypothetical protein